MGIKIYREFCALHGLSQIIDNATRITETTSSLLDHILTNVKDKVSQSDVINIGLSDHQMIFCTRKKLKTQNRRKNVYQNMVIKTLLKRKIT